jgi:hypothetical protein
MRWKLLEETNSPLAAESNDGDVTRVDPTFGVSLIFSKVGRGSRRDLLSADRHGSGQSICDLWCVEDEDKLLRCI